MDGSHITWHFPISRSPDFQTQRHNMEVFNLIVGFPANVSAAILFDWLETKAVVQLDSAFSIHQLRSDFLSLYASEGKALHMTMNINSNSATWLQRRNVKLFELWVNWTDGDVDKVSPLIADRVKSARFDYCKRIAEYLSLLAAKSCMSVDILLLGFYNVPDCFVSALNKLPLLRTLELEHCIDSSNYNFEGLQLDSLHSLVSRDGLHDSIFQAVLRAAPNLSTVHVRAQSPLQLHTIGILGPVLRCLRLGNNMFTLTDECVSHIVTCCPNISALELSGCLLISDDSLAAIASGLKFLTKLRIFKNGIFSTEAMVALLEQRGSQLLNLQLLFCPILNNDAICAIAKNCPNLRTINLTGEIAELPTAFEKLFSSCTQLENIELCKETVGVNTLRAIADNCANLRSLQLWSSMIGISREKKEDGDAVGGLTHKAVHLQLLIIPAECLLVSAETRALWLQRRPQLTIANSGSIFDEELSA